MTVKQIHLNATLCATKKVFQILQHKFHNHSKKKKQGVEHDKCTLSFYLIFPE